MRDLDWCNIRIPLLVMKSQGRTVRVSLTTR